MAILKKKILMFRRWFRILLHKSAVAVDQKEGTLYHREQIAGYYNDMTEKVGPNTVLDEDGIPLTQIAGQEYVYFPIAVFQYALGCYDWYLRSREIKYLDMFMKNAEWALNHQMNQGEWDCFGPLRSHNYTVSSMGQGEGISVLCRAYTESGDKRYLIAAAKAADFMLRPVKDGGTAVYSGDKLYLEEYPQDKRRGVLNGWIFSAFGLYDIQILDSSYKKYFIKTCDALGRELSNYNAGYWSYYDLEKHIASPAYHRLHAAQLNVLNELYPCAPFVYYAGLFQRQINNPMYRWRALFVKILQKLFEKPDCIIIQ